jgi:uncharacterized repeat protein (TIGR01451 family)
MVAGLLVQSVTFAQEGTGSLTISLSDGAGNPVGVGCFEVTDAAGVVQQICDDDGDGLATLAGLPTGAATVTQTSGPDGYHLSVPGSTTIEVGVDARVDLVATALVVETPIPTEEPTETVTVERIETATSTVEPATPEPQTPLATEAPPTETATEEATGEQSFGIAAAQQPLGIRLSLYAQAAPEAPLVPFASGGTLPANMGFVVSASYGAVTPLPTGTVTFKIYSNPTCDGNPFSFVHPIDANGAIANTPGLTVAEPRIINVRYEYSGDANYAAESSACGEYIFSIGRAPGPTFSFDFAINSSTAPNLPEQGASVVVGTNLFVAVRVAGLINPSGATGPTATLYLYRGLDCAGAPVRTATEIVPFAAGADMGTNVFYQGLGNLAAGSYSLRVFYLDPTGTNSPSWSGCDVNYTLTKASPTLTLSVSSTAVSTGQSASGSVSMEGGSSATGTLMYLVYSGSTCSAGTYASRGPLALPGGSLPGSGDIYFNVAGSFSWQATYSGDASFEPAVSNCVTFTVVAPRLELSAQASTTSVNLGDPFGYTIKVRNIELGTALNVTIEDVLPVAFSWEIESATAGADCSIESSTNRLGCSIASIGGPGSVTIVVKTTGIRTNVCGPVSNSASLTAQNHGALSAPAPTVTIKCGDLAVTKIAESSAAPGGQLRFLITARNAGTAPLSGVTLSDDLTSVVPGVTWSIDTATSTAGCAIASRVLTCNWGDLTVGASKQVKLKATANQACGTYNNTATGAATNEPAIANVESNSATAAITVLCVDLTIGKTALNAQVPAGQPIGFLITARNAGNDTATGVKVTDTLPSGFTWTKDSGSCTISGSTLTCNFGSVPAGESRSVTITAPSANTNCSTVTNKATVSGTNELSTAKGNNSSTTSLKLTCPELELIKDPVSATVNSGGPVIFTIKVTNRGDAAATNLRLIDGLPYGVEWSTSTPGCWVLGGALACQFASLGVGELRTITVSGVPAAGTCGPIGSYAFVWSDNERLTDTVNNIEYGEATIRCS